MRFLCDRESLTKSLGFSIFASLLQSPCSSSLKRTDSQSMISLTSSKKAVNFYPSSLKLILMKHREFVDYMFGAIKGTSSSLVRTYALDCLRIILNLYLEYKTTVDGNERIIEDEDSKNEELKNEEFQSNICSIVEELIISRIGEEINFSKLLHDMNGNAIYFKSLLNLFKTLMMCNLTSFYEIVFEEEHFSRLKQLLIFDEYKKRFMHHLSFINIPMFFKTDIFMNRFVFMFVHTFVLYFVLLRIWTTSDINIQQLEAISSIFNLFNFLCSKTTHINKHLFFKHLSEKYFCIHQALEIMQHMIHEQRYDLICIIFDFLTNMNNYNSKELRLALFSYKPKIIHFLLPSKIQNHKKVKYFDEHWCPEFIFKQISKCLQSQNEIYEHSVLNFLQSVCASFPMSNKPHMKRKRYKINEIEPSLMLIINHIIHNLIEKTLMLNYNNLHLPKLLQTYYQTLSVILSVSPMAKDVCSYYCTSGDFIQWLISRLSQILAIFLLKVHILNDGHSTLEKKHKKLKYFQNSPSNNFSNWMGNGQTPKKYESEHSPNIHKNNSHFDEKYFNVHQKSVKNTKAIAMELIRILQLIQNYLYLASADMKVNFVLYFLCSYHFSFLEPICM